MRQTPVNHPEPGHCYVCGTGPGGFGRGSLSLVEVTAGAAWWECELCAGCAVVGVPLLARLFQDDGDRVEVEA